MASEMNPQTVWDQLRRAYAQRQWESVRTQGQKLLFWLDHGGEPPKTSSDIPLDDLWHWSLSRSACTFAIAQAREQIGD